MSRHVNHSTAHRLLNPAPVAGVREASPNPEGRGRPCPSAGETPYTPVNQVFPDVTVRRTPS